VHYYKRNLGDYAKKAGRLTMLQHGAYTLLLDSCYDREQFPTLEQAIEWTWASSEAEIDAVKFVLNRFFTPDSDGRYVQTRIAEELDGYHKTATTNKRIAEERETKRKEKGTKRTRSVNESSRSVNEPPPNHKPLTINQEPLTNNQTKNQDRLVEPSQFDEIRLAYPRRGGGQKWGDAERAYKKLLAQKHTHDEILAGVIRYKDYLTATGGIGTQYVQQAATFLGLNKGFLEPWAIPAETVDVRQMSAVDRVKFKNSQTGAKNERVVSEQGRQDFGSLVTTDRIVW